MASLKNFDPHFLNSIKVNILSSFSDSSVDSLISQPPKTKASTVKKKELKKPRLLCGLEFFEEVVRLFYANICVSNDSGELETLVMGSCIIVNELLFEDVFGTKFFGVIPYMNGTWPDDFEGPDYFEVGNKWVKKDSVQARADTSKPTKISAESASLLLQDFDELKTLILVVESGLETLQDAVEKVFRLEKDTSTKNSYSCRSKNVECYYNSFCGLGQEGRNQFTANANAFLCDDVFRIRIVGGNLANLHLHSISAMKNLRLEKVEEEEVEVEEEKFPHQIKLVPASDIVTMGNSSGKRLIIVT
uniref:Uncharacterized protein n=1 Tax=Solanum tuberosum TaxID=4113 RepID=M1DU89_SOLTU